MRRSISFAVLLVAGLLVTSSGAARTVETRITVRALSQGAKFIGSSVGGARVVIRDAETGDVLARGVTEGSTGNTQRIMRTRHGRNRALATTGTAKYSTSLWLERPRRLKITAFGPLNHVDDASTAAVIRKVLPGRDLTGGDGVRLTLSGFVVDILQPEHHDTGRDTVSMDVLAHVTMMCGCPITPGGLWDANAYRIVLEIYRDGEKVHEHPLHYAGEPSRFVRRVTLHGDGHYRLRASAYDPATGNTGYESVTYEMSPADRGLMP